MGKEKQKVSDDLKLREGEINKLKQQISRNNKMREAIQRKLQLSEEVCIKYKQFYTKGWKTWKLLFKKYTMVWILSF